MTENSLTRSVTEVSESNFLSKVFLWMALGLGASAAAALWLLSQQAVLMAVLSNKILFFGLIIAEFALVIALSAAIRSLSTGVATLMFFGYSLLNGISLAPILLLYTGASVATTFAVTAGTFFFFSVYGLTTKKDLTSVGGLCVMGLIGIILASLVNIFLKSPAVMWVTTFIGIAVFLGLIAYDTQKLKAMHATIQAPDEREKAAVLGALALYLDFINLFVMLLRIFGNRRN